MAGFVRRRGAGFRDAFIASPGHLIALSSLALLTLSGMLLLLFQHPYPLSNQPFPDAHEYINAAYRIVHGEGYTTTVRDNAFSPHIHQIVNPPRFPPGTSLVLAPFALIGSYPANVEFGARLIVLGLVLAVGWAGYSLGGWYPALLAAFVTAMSSFATFSAHVVMSDALGALLTVVCLPLMRLKEKWAMYLAGFAAGYGFVCREAGVVVVASLLIVIAGSDRFRVAAGAGVPIFGLALYNWSTFGAPWSTGYGYWLGPFREYSLSYVTKHSMPVTTTYGSSLQLFHLVGHSSAGLIGTVPNVLFYPLIALGFSATFGPPFLTLVGLVTAIRSWSRREARFTLILTAGSAVLLMANFSQDPRLIAGPCILLTVWGVFGLVQLMRAIWRRYGDGLTARLDLTRQNA
jgi:hypothetical protein